MTASPLAAASWARNEIVPEFSAQVPHTAAPGSAIAPMWRTADWAYLRLHQGRLAFPPTYSATTLRFWRRQLEQTWETHHDIFVYFNNDPGAAAVRDARRFRRNLGG